MASVVIIDGTDIGVRSITRIVGIIEDHSREIAAVMIDETKRQERLKCERRALHNRHNKR